MWPFRGAVNDPETKKPLHIKALAVVTRTGKVIEQGFDSNGPDAYKVFSEKYASDTDVDRPGHALVVTGFVSGSIGFWMKVPNEVPKESRPGAAAAAATAGTGAGKANNWILARVITKDAHGPGPRITMPDGSVTCMGVRGLTLTEDKKTLLSAGADGVVLAWDIRQTIDDDVVNFRCGTLHTIHLIHSITVSANRDVQFGVLHAPRRQSIFWPGRGSLVLRK